MVAPKVDALRFAVRFPIRSAMSRPISQTCRLFIGGQFPRSESGRTQARCRPDGSLLAHVPRASAADLASAIEAARSAQPGWAAQFPQRKGEILYRMAEGLQSRAAAVVDHLMQEGLAADQAQAEVDAAVGSLVHFAGWSDKFAAFASRVNPVASAHLSISVPEPVGVVAVVAGPGCGLRDWVEGLAAAVVGGNAVVLLTGMDHPLTGTALAETVATSGLPVGVFNLLTINHEEMLPEVSRRGDLDGLWLLAVDDALSGEPAIAAAAGSQRVCSWSRATERDPLERILAAQKLKTIWQPVGV